MDPLVRKPPAAEDVKKRALFEAAVGVFMRYGYRKTSMEEVAAAAQISRQGLYLHFANKEELFRATVHHVLQCAFRSAEGVLRQEDLPLEARLLRAFDQWMGKYVGMMGADASDLVQAAECLEGPAVADYEKRFAGNVTRAFEDGVVAAAYALAGIAPAQLTSCLIATARGLKTHCRNRAEFCEEFATALRIMFAAAGQPV